MARAARLTGDTQHPVARQEGRAHARAPQRVPAAATAPLPVVPSPGWSGAPQHMRLRPGLPHPPQQPQSEESLLPRPLSVCVQSYMGA
eukprot:5961555-Pleurochrysis_carterae.AAC.2